MAITRKRAGIVALAITILLAGCAATPKGASELTLADTKSPVQLLRNDAIDRVEQRFIAEVLPTTDGSEACLDAGENAGGLIRQWKSGAEIVLAKDADVSYVSERLVQGFTAKGWDDEAISDHGPFWLTKLTSTRSVAAVEIGWEEHPDGSVIKITTTGPCVATGGPDSDEVVNLES
jgi:hypothetical protein